MESLENIVEDEVCDLRSLFFEEKYVQKENLREHVRKQRSNTKQSDENQKDDEKICKTPFECKICGEKTTTILKFEDHKKLKHHKEKLVVYNRRNRKEKKKRGKLNKKHRLNEEKNKVQIDPLDKKIRTVQTVTKKIQEVYHFRKGDPLPELHRLYIVTLTTLLALRFCLNKDKRHFKMSIINSAWNEFGDIVIEFYDNEENIVEIQAIQCKQIHNRNKISLSTLGAENGKFSVKTRCEIIRNLSQRKHYNNTHFKLFTISSLAITKDKSPQFFYNDKELEDWKNRNDKDKWKNKALIIPEFSYTSLLNASDDPDDIYIFKIVDQDNQLMSIDLNKFSIFTNQPTLEGLKRLIKLTIRHRFENTKDITSDLINYVNAHFTTSKHNCHKLSKKNYLFKLAELLLRPFDPHSENTSSEERLRLWNDVKFDVIVMKNHLDLIEKTYSALNCIVREKTQFFPSGTKLHIQKNKIKDENLSSIIFEGFNNDVQIMSLSQVYVALWKAKLTPLILSTNNKDHLNLIIKIIVLLNEENVGLQFIILTDLQTDGNMFPENFDVFLTLKDLDGDKNSGVLQRLRETVVVKCFNLDIYLRDILEYNTNFLEDNTPDALLNMLLNDYSFTRSEVGNGDDVFGNSLVLSDDAVKEIKLHIDHESEIKSKSLSYIVNMKGKRFQVEVPPVL